MPIGPLVLHLNDAGHSDNPVRREVDTSLRLGELISAVVLPLDGGILPMSRGSAERLSSHYVHFWFRWRGQYFAVGDRGEEA